MNNKIFPHGCKRNVILEQTRHEFAFKNAGRILGEESIETVQEGEASEDDERTLAFQAMKAQQDINPSELKCTRVCNQFKTGVPCTHPNCTFAHYLCDLKPKPCIYAKCGCNKEHKGCEFAHITQRIRKDGKCTFIYETALEIADRLKLVKELPMYPEKKDKAQEADKDTDKESNTSFKISDEEFTAQHALLPSESKPVVQKTEFFGDSDDEDWWKTDDKTEKKDVKIECRKRCRNR